MATDTIQQLATITDAAQFERIATSVLRSANPGLYANLSHQGVNTDGKTVKAPLDNMGWVRVDGEPMFVAGAHTTASRDDLERKWLHDPATVKPRSASKKTTQPAGDLVKALGEISKLREQRPGLRATLALTCNREEPSNVRLQAEGLQAHLRAHSSQLASQKMRRAHPLFERPKRMLNSPFSNFHHLWCLVQPALHIVQYCLMLPASHSPLLARRALRFQRAALAIRTPVAVHV